MRIACLHTADVHVATFATLFQTHAPDADVRHVVRSDLLATAQTAGISAVRSDMADVLRDIADADAILCSCSTLGPLVDQLGPAHAVRIDRPAMEQAARLGSRPLLAICLESTRAASLALLKSCDEALKPDVLLCAGAWAHFESGDQDQFAQSIASSIEQAFNGHSCVVLGQASMRVAEPLLRRLGVPVLSSPEPAVLATIAKARS